MNDTSRTQAPLLIGYDASADARQAIEVAAALFPGSPSLVLTVWRPLIVTLASYPMAAAAPLSSDVTLLDRELQAGAEKTAAEGAERARAAGLEAQALTAEADGPVWQAVVAAADANDASTIVLGPRGLSGLKSVLLGSVSHGVLQHARRPVLVVPPPDR